VLVIDERKCLLEPRYQSKAPSLSEKEIVQTAAEVLLRESPYPEIRGVSCRFHEGVLTLRGQVPSYFLKQIAQTVVGGMDDIGEVNNQVEVVAPSSRP
jgi:hypothetical protein